MAAKPGKTRDTASRSWPYDEAMPVHGPNFEAIQVAIPPILDSGRGVPL
jgi:hypothetical protein